MSSLKKKATVVLLPIKTSNKFISDRKVLCFDTVRDKQLFNPFKNEFYHLYIIDDSDLKEGDWYLNWETNYATDPKERWVMYNCVSKPNGTNPKKIIVTTNKYIYIDKLDFTENVNFKSLIRNKDDYFYKCLPQPSQQFIEKYIEEYNKGNIITDVMVEYKKCNEINPTLGKYGTISNGGSWDYKLKTDKNNCITISKYKQIKTKKL